MISDRVFSFSSDLWALGVMLYQLNYGCVPFKGKSQKETFEQIKECQLKTTDAPFAVNDLISKLVVREPENRLGANDISELLKHPYFCDIDFSTIDTQLPPQSFTLS